MSDKKSGAVADYAGVGVDARIEVKSPNTTYSDEYITSTYKYEKNDIKVLGNRVVVTPRQYQYTFRTKRRVPKVGLMMVGWGGNNGSTVTAGIIANKQKMSWMTKEGRREANYFGSVTQASMARIGSNEEGKEVYAPLNTLLPMVSPNNLVLGGWDLNNADLAKSMERACVLDYDLQRQLVPHLKAYKPLPSIYYKDFIAANQSDRANNLIPSNGNRQEDLEHLRKDIREFKKKNGLDTVIIVWTANTERFTDVRKGLNMTADEVLASIKRNDSEISPSQVFAVASILERCPYLNGSPQNTLVPGIMQLAEKYGVFIGGDDFKSGQTKIKSVLADFLTTAGIKLESIVSYNHLGNNDGKNLSAPEQFRSKEISKSNVVDDMVASNTILFKPKEHPDHVVVIKYVPFVKDSKRAMDEYVSSIFMGGLNTISIHNTCEDSLLASPIIIDLAILAEMMTRIQYKTESMKDFESFHSVLSILSYLLKAPVVAPGTPVVNALFKQHRCITNIFLAVLGIPPENDMLLEHKTKLPKALPIRSAL